MNRSEVIEEECSVDEDKCGVDEKLNKVDAVENFFGEVKKKVFWILLHKIEIYFTMFNVQCSMYNEKCIKKLLGIKYLV